MSRMVRQAEGGCHAPNRAGMRLGQCCCGPSGLLPLSRSSRMEKRHLTKIAHYSAVCWHCAIRFRVGPNAEFQLFRIDQFPSTQKTRTGPYISFVGAEGVLQTLYELARQSGQQSAFFCASTLVFRYGKKCFTVHCANCRVAARRTGALFSFVYQLQGFDGVGLIALRLRNAGF